MGVLHKNECNIVIKVVVPIIDIDGFTMDGYYTWQTMIALSIKWTHFSTTLQINF